MTKRDRIPRAVKGKGADGVPWAPRFPEDMEPFFEQMFRVVADLAAQVVFFGAKAKRFIRITEMVNERRSLPMSGE